MDETIEAAGATRRLFCFLRPRSARAAQAHELQLGEDRDRHCLRDHEDNNALAMSDSAFEGAIGKDILTVDDTGNVLSGDGNNLCTAAPGGFTGTIGFDGSPDIVDGSSP